MIKLTKFLLTAVMLVLAMTARSQSSEEVSAYEEMKGSMTLHINGSHDFVRNLVYMNDLTSDVSSCVWMDYGMSDLCNSSLKAWNPFVEVAWVQLFSCIDLCNKFLHVANGSNTVTGQQLAEARLLRALYYSYALSLWGDVPLRTTYIYDNTEKRVSRTEVFKFLETELSEVIGILPAKAGYGQLTSMAARLLLARLYLNSEVYTGQTRWNDAKTLAQEVIDGGYSLCDDYERLFMGDNDSNGGQNETLLPVVIDGGNADYFGNTTFIIASTYTADMPGNGMNQGWAGVILRKSMLDVFNLPHMPILANTAEARLAANDDRCMMTCSGTVSLDNFADGVKCTKYTNLRSNGDAPLHIDHADTDFPLLRLAEAYLIAAEADARINGQVCTDAGKALVNTLRSRAHAAPLSNVTLQDICDEWLREFYLEGQRRTHLVRFGYYSSSSYKWDGKSSHVLNWMPVPSSVLGMYPNYAQNPGYEDNSIKPEGMAMEQPAFAGVIVDLKKYQSLQFSWKRPTNFGAEDMVTYELEFSTDAAFTKPSKLTVNYDNTFKVPTSDLYNILLQDNVADGAQVQVYARVVCHEVATDPVTFTVINSKLTPHIQPWFLVGEGIGDGSWNNSVSGIGSSMIPFFINQDYPNGTADMTITDYFDGKGFKGIGKPGSWDEQIGAFGDNLVINDYSSDNISLYGYYTINFSSATYTVQAYQNHNDAKEYNSIGIIGSFNNWNDDYPMNRTSATSHVWYSQLTLTEDTEMKIRANQEWTYNWGGEMFPYGTGVADGINIMVKAGNWKIFFNDISGQMIFLDAETGGLALMQSSDPITDGKYLNKEFATIGATAAATINMSESDSAKVANLDDGIYHHLYLVVGGESRVLLEDDCKIAAELLKEIADSYSDKTMKVENGYKYTTFSAQLRGFCIKQDLEVWTESEPFIITLVEAAPMVSDNYYYVGGLTNWSLEDKSRPMTRESDYVYSYSWTITEQEWFAFMPEEPTWANLIRPTSSGASLGTGNVIIGDGNAWFVDGSAGKKEVKMVIDLSTFTYTLTEIPFSGISTQFSDTKQQHKIFDLRGCEVKGSLKPGIYIRNGRKIVINR